LRQIVPTQTKKLPHHALYPIAPHGVAVFSRYRKPESPLTGPRAGIHRKKNKIPRKNAPPHIVTIEKIRPPNKPAGAGKRMSAFSLHGAFPNQTERRLRPLARLRRSTARPPGVLMRARKPWLLFRLILLG
jgi:hypothetical protein